MDMQIGMILINGDDFMAISFLLSRHQEVGNGVPSLKK